MPGPCRVRNFLSFGIEGGWGKGRTETKFEFDSAKWSFVIDVRYLLDTLSVVTKKPE